MSTTPAGGGLTLTVDGDVTSAATITAPTINSLLISGDLAGDVHCDDIPSAGTLTVVTDTSGDIVVSDTLDGSIALKKEVATTASITVVTMAGVIRTNATSGSYAGDMRLDNGLPSGASVFIDGEMTGTGSIDLTGDGVGLNSQFHVDSAATGAIILNGGLVDGDVRLADANSGGFAGTATFTGVSDQVAGKGQILIYATGTPTDGLTGTVHITTGTMAGKIVSSWTQNGGLIDIDNDCTGTLDLGTIRDGGTVNIDGDLTSTGFIDIEGNVNDGGAITIDGDADGDIGIEVGVDGDITILGTLNGALDVAQGTGVNSLIHVLGGLGSGGSVVIASVATYDASGDMVFGPTSPPVSLDNLTFAGCVEIGHGADLEGDITLVGCLSSDPLICVTGATNGTITLTQTDCTPDDHVVDDSCPACP